MTVVREVVLMEERERGGGESDVHVRKLVNGFSQYGLRSRSMKYPLHFEKMQSFEGILCKFRLSDV